MEVVQKSKLNKTKKNQIKNERSNIRPVVLKVRSGFW